MLEAFFTPVQKSITKQYAKASGVLGSELKIYSNKFPSTKNIDIAIIGLGTNADLCRKELYALHYHFSGVEVADFGNLNHDGSGKNLLDGMRECIFALREENIIPIFIGENSNYSEALFKSINYQKTDIAMVSPYIAYNPDELAWKLEQKSKLFHASFIGIQNFLNSHTTIQLSSDIFSEQIRLGDLRSNTAQVEPLLRQADLFEFDLHVCMYMRPTSRVVLVYRHHWLT